VQFQGEFRGLVGTSTGPFMASSPRGDSQVTRFSFLAAVCRKISAKHDQWVRDIYGQRVHRTNRKQ